MSINCNDLNNFLIGYLENGTNIRWQSVAVPTYTEYCVAFWTPDLGFKWEMLLDELADCRTAIFSAELNSPRYIDAITLYTIESSEQKMIDFETLRSNSKKTIVSEIILELMEFMIRNKGNFPNKEQIKDIYKVSDEKSSAFFNSLKTIHMHQEIFLSNEYSSSHILYKRQQELKNSLEARESLYKEGYSMDELFSSLNKT